MQFTEQSKQIHYLNKLLFEFQKKNLLRKTYEKLTGKKSVHTKTDIARFLHHEKSRSARNFIDNLIEEQVFVKAGERNTGNGKPTDLYRLNKTRLLEVFTESERYQENKRLYAKSMDYKGEVFNFK